MERTERRRRNMTLINQRRTNMKRLLTILTVLTTAIMPLPAQAYQQTLPKDSLICSTKRSINEAIRAVAASDVQWLGSLSDCILTKQPLKAQRLECEGRI